MANGNGKNNKKKWFIGGGIVALLVILIVIIGASSGGAKIPPDKIGKVEQGDIAKSVVATGKIEPKTKVEIKSKASGIIQKLLVDVGDKVKEGQVLAELDKEQIQARVREARAQLTSAEANLKASEAEMQRAKVDAEAPEVPLLKRAYERAQNMASDGVVSQAQMDDAQKNYEMAVNKQNLAKAQMVSAKAKLAQAQAQVTQYEAALANTMEELRYTTITSPIDGYVLQRPVEVGDAVSSILVLGSQATLVMVVGDTHEVYVKGKVDESDIGKVYEGQPARIKVESFKDDTFNGKVTKITPMGTEKDNVTTFEVRVSIDNPGGKLKAAMTANAEIVLEEHKNVTIIPEGSLIYEGDGKERKSFVEVVDPKAKDGKRKVAVTTGISNGAKTELLNASLKKGDQVVLQ